MALSTVLLTGVLRQAHDIAPFYEVPLYFSKNLDLTGIVYAIFLILCIVGAREWRRSMTEVAATPEAVRELQPA